MNLAGRVIAYLEARDVDCAIVGGTALGAHGIARATLDVDVLVANVAVLEREFWTAAHDLTSVEIRRGDVEDPLRGVVRIAGADRPVDVLVGRGAWTAAILKRRIRIAIAGVALPFVDRADLVLLKLYAGGPQDLLDVELLLAAEPDALLATVNARIGEAPAGVRDLWRKVAPR